MTMWPLAASGGWPLARGSLHSDSVNAQRMRPYMPGGRWRGGGAYKRGTTVLSFCEDSDILRFSTSAEKSNLSKRLKNRLRSSAYSSVVFGNLQFFFFTIRVPTHQFHAMPDSFHVIFCEIVFNSILVFGFLLLNYPFEFSVYTLSFFGTTLTEYTFLPIYDFLKAKLY